MSLMGLVSKTRSLINIAKSVGSFYGGDIRQDSGWAIADEGGNVVIPITAVLSCSVTAEGQVVSESVEEGSFTSYNKTTAPIQIQAEWAFSGTPDEIQNVLTQISSLKQECDVFSVVTPVHEYQNMTLERYDYKMEQASGYGMIVINAVCVEIREVKAAYSQVDASTIAANQQISAADATSADDVSAVDTGQTSTSDIDMGGGSAEGEATREAGESTLHVMAGTVIPTSSGD